MSVVMARGIWNDLPKRNIHEKIPNAAKRISAFTFTKTWTKPKASMGDPSKNHIDQVFNHNITFIFCRHWIYDWKITTGIQGSI